MRKSQRIKLFEKPNSDRLSFRSVNDARDFAKQSVQNGRDWLAFHNLDFSKRYVEGDLEIVLNLSAGKSSSDCQLVFFAIPQGI